MNTHRLKNIRFSSEEINDDMKIIKIKGGFSCSEERAIEILQHINANESIDVEGNIYSDLIKFGINCDMQSLERLRHLEEKREEEKRENEQFEIDKVSAESWYETLTDVEKKYVRVLAHSKFSLVAGG